jgi:hypothetical protein
MSGCSSENLYDNLRDFCSLVAGDLSIVTGVMVVFTEKGRLTSPYCLKLLPFVFIRQEVTPTSTMRTVTGKQ